MKEFIEKLIGRLEEEYINCFTTGDYKYNNAIDKTKEIANELAEEYKGKYVRIGTLEQFKWERDVAIEQLKELGYGLGQRVGWIPCSERLPKDDSICIVTVEYPNNETVVDYGWFDRKGVCWFVGVQEFRTSNILAWQPLPAPYKKGE